MCNDDCEVPSTLRFPMFQALTPFRIRSHFYRWWSNERATGNLDRTNIPPAYMPLILANSCYIAAIAGLDHCWFVLRACIKKLNTSTLVSPPGTDVNVVLKCTMQIMPLDTTCVDFTAIFSPYFSPNLLYASTFVKTRVSHAAALRLRRLPLHDR